MLTVILKDYAGQNCDVALTKRNNGSKYVTFKCSQEYGNPVLEEEQFKKLCNYLQDMEESW